MNHHNTIFNEAVELSNDGQNFDALNKYYSLYKKMSDIGKIDRLYPLKRNVMKSIIHIENKLGNANKAKLLAKEWMDSDTRDIEAKIVYLNISTESTEENILNEYQALYEKFPKSRRVVDAYNNFLKRNAENK